MEESIKDDLIARFRDYLDSVDLDKVDPDSADTNAGQDIADPADEVTVGSDLYSLFVELAGLRTEVRTESRLVKDALDQFRAIFDRLQKDHTVLEREVERARAEVRDQARILLRPLLLELLDLRDRLEAGLREPQGQKKQRWWAFGLSRTLAQERGAWLEGQVMTLRRLDRILLDRQVVPLDVVARPFDPRLARAVATIEDTGRDQGLVVEVVRAGFSWNGDVLRTADVVVNKRSNVKEGHLS